MQTIAEIAISVANRRRALRMTQAEVAAQARVSSDTLFRFELGRVAEFGARKLLSVLSVLGMELEFMGVQTTGDLDELLKEHMAPRR